MAWYMMRIEDGDIGMIAFNRQFGAGESALLRTGGN